LLDRSICNVFTSVSKLLIPPYNVDIFPSISFLFAVIWFYNSFLFAIILPSNSFLVVNIFPSISFSKLFNPLFKLRFKVDISLLFVVIWFYKSVLFVVIWFYKSVLFVVIYPYKSVYKVFIYVVNYVSTYSLLVASFKLNGLPTATIF